MSERIFCVYIIASQRNGTLYTGMTSNLPRRIFEHQNGLVEGFAKKYHVKILVYYEVCDSPEAAIAREKTIKHWPRHKKLEAIEAKNPDWQDLVHELV